MHPAADRPGRAFDRVRQLRRGHRAEADLTVLNRNAQAIVALKVGVEVGAHAEDQGAGRRGGSIEEKVDEPPRILDAALVLRALGLMRLGLGVELLPLVDIKQQTGTALVRLQAVAHQLGNGDLALAEAFRVRVELGAGRDRVGILRRWGKGPCQLVQRLGLGTQADDVPHRLLPRALLAAQRREQAGIDDRRLAAAGAADHRHRVGGRALPDLGHQLVDEPGATEEQAGILLAERQQAAIGAQAGKKRSGTPSIARPCAPATRRCSASGSSRP